MNDFNDTNKRYAQKTVAQCSNLVDLSETDDATPANSKSLNRSNSIQKYKSRSNDQFDEENIIDNSEEFNELSNDYYPEDNDNYESLPNEELNQDMVHEDDSAHKNPDSVNHEFSNANLAKNIKYMKPLPNQSSQNFSQNHLKQYIDQHNRIKHRQQQQQQQQLQQHQQQVSFNRNLMLQHQFNLSSKHSSPIGASSGGLSLNHSLNQLQPNFSNRFANNTSGNTQRTSFIPENSSLNYAPNDIKANRSLDGYNHKSHIKQAEAACQSFSSPSNNQFAHLPAYSSPSSSSNNNNNNPESSYSLASKNAQQFNNEMKQDIDIEDLFKGDGPKYLQLDSYKDFKPPITVLSDNKYYIDEQHASIAYSKSKSRRNFAAHLTKLVFTPRERLESNCNGRFGKKALDSVRLCAIRNTLFKYYPCKQSTLILNGDKITSGDHDESNVWVRDCIPAIDESNRVLKKQLISWYKKNHNTFQIKVELKVENNNMAANNTQSSSGGNGMVSNTACSTNPEFGGQKYNFDNLDIDQEFEDDFEEDHE
jgi:hypothetical protein